MKENDSAIENFFYYTPFFAVSAVLLAAAGRILAWKFGWMDVNFTDGVWSQLLIAVAATIHTIVMYSNYFDFDNLDNDEDRNLTGAVDGWIALVLIALWWFTPWGKFWSWAWDFITHLDTNISTAFDWLWNIVKSVLGFCDAIIMGAADGVEWVFDLVGNI